MSEQSIAGQQAWKRRAPGYAAELRAEIERDIALRSNALRSGGRPPLWLRIKRRLPLWLQIKARRLGLAAQRRAGTYGLSHDPCIQHLIGRGPS